MRGLVRRHAPRALFLGDRYASCYYPEVARAAGRYVDVCSSNMNQFWNDGTFPRCYLETLHALTGRPVLVSEIYLAANQNRSGNRNTYGAYPVVDTQSERAAALRNTLETLARLPYVVGADWFQFADEPTHGRPDGENFNFGLVDINERPYEEVTAVFSALNVEQLRTASSRPRPDAADGIAPAPADPFANFVPTRALKNWDRERGFVKPVSEFPLADLYVCWELGRALLGLCAMELSEAASGSLSKIDRPLWSVGTEPARPLAPALVPGARPSPATRVCASKTCSERADSTIATSLSWKCPRHCWARTASSPVTTSLWIARF